MTTINCRGKLLDLGIPRVMAIVNLSPESFYHSLDGAKDKELLNFVGKALEDGADIIDVGGMSTRPGSVEISVEMEWERIGKGLKAIRSEFLEAILSVDTYRGEIASRSLDLGVDLINDISGGAFDPNIIEVVAGQQVPYVLMHNLAKSEVMQNYTDYEDMLEEMFRYFVEKIHLLEEKGIKDIVIDPGFGFSKTIDQNYLLLKNLSVFEQLERPLLVGLSRKSMLYKRLGTTPEETLCMTAALNFKALESGANILRVHDAREARQCIQIFESYSRV